MSNKVLMILKRILLSGCLIIDPHSAHAVDPVLRTIVLEVGGSAFLNVNQVSRIAVGDSQIAQVSASGMTGILIFGKARGSTRADVWSKTGRHHQYEVTVTPRGFEANYLSVKKLLSDISTITVSTSGDKIILEGMNVSDHDKRRVAQISAQYPDILDLTNAVGWDRMIMLDVLVIELPSATLRELGLKWDANPNSGLKSALDWTTGSPDPGVTRLPAGLNSSHAGAMIGLNTILSARIDALSRKGEAVILAQPQLLTRSGSTANFLAGGEVPYSSTDKDGRVNTFFKKYGVSLNITPQANGRDTVRSSIEIEVSSVDPTIMLPNGPAMRVRRASTEFNVRSGQTLILGGFISREKSRDWEGLPGVSDTSILRHVFGSERTSERHTELAILVTPHIVDPAELELDQRSAVARDVIDKAFSESTGLSGLAGSNHFDLRETFVNSESLTDQWDE